MVDPFVHFLFSSFSRYKHVSFTFLCSFHVNWLLFILSISSSFHQFLFLHQHIIVIISKWVKKRICYKCFELIIDWNIKYFDIEIKTHSQNKTMINWYVDQIMYIYKHIKCWNKICRLCYLIWFWIEIHSIIIIMKYSNRIDILRFNQIRTFQFIELKSHFQCQIFSGFFVSIMLINYVIN